MNDCRVLYHNFSLIANSKVIFCFLTNRLYNLMKGFNNCNLTEKIISNLKKYMITFKKNLNNLKAFNEKLHFILNKKLKCSSNCCVEIQLIILKLIHIISQNAFFNNVTRGRGKNHNLNIR